MNLIPLIALVIGFLYLGQYRESLIAAELQTLRAQAQLYAGAIAEGAVRPAATTRLFFTEDDHDADHEKEQLIPDLSRRMIRRLARVTEGRTRLYDQRGYLLGDTHELRGPDGIIEVAALDPLDSEMVWHERLKVHVARWLDRLFFQPDLPLFPSMDSSHAFQFPDVYHAMNGKVSSSAWLGDDGALILTVAAPVQKVRKVMGVVLLTLPGNKIEADIGHVRLNILFLSALALIITVILSLYLGSVIASPLKKLATAAYGIGAMGVRRQDDQQIKIPDLSHRRDEIGALSVALRDMTQALWDRMDSIERFAADVAHELKNPLTSLRSAVETALLLDDPKKKEKLMDVILHDIQRLDRLISDISNASRLDAELSRSSMHAMNLIDLLQNLIDAYRSPLDRLKGENANHIKDDQFNIRLNYTETDPLIITGNSDRLGQVFQNLISNALSFSPKNGVVTIHVRQDKNIVQIKVEDEGVGIPEAKLETIFERFYSERPQSESFGNHSGLGLSIARQIITAHGGQIFAENIKDADQKIKGSIFTVLLPV